MKAAQTRASDEFPEERSAREVNAKAPTRPPAGPPLAKAVTHPERVLFPRDGITKGELVQYYRDVAPFLLPYLEERPLTLQRFPQGIDGFSFFEKKVPRGAPSFVKTTRQPQADGKGTVDYVLCNDEATLTWAANLGSITFHVWMSRLESIESPDYLLFDLDPWEGCTARTLVQVALGARDALDAIGLSPLVKTTGGKGLHLIVPLEPIYPYEAVRNFGELVARRLATVMPDLVTLERSKAKRLPGRVYLDWVQMGLGKTLVPPFSVRARDGAPVSMPLGWAEVEAMRTLRGKDTLGLGKKFTVKNVPAFLAQKGDAWETAYRERQRLEPALEKARGLWKGQ